MLVYQTKTIIEQTRSRHVISLLWLLFVLTTPLIAQTNKPCNLVLYGDVTDATTGKAIAGAYIQLMENNKISGTDERGHFLIKDICTNQYNVHIHSLGYEELDTVIMLRNDIHAHFTLKTKPYHINEITISAQKIEKKPLQPMSTLSGRELDNSRGQSLGEVVKQIPGVNVLQTGPTILKPVIQGMHSNRIVLLNNGIRQEGQQWGSEHAPEIDPFVANVIKVIKGAAGVQYGPEAMGGVLLVEPKALRKEPGIDGAINMGGFSNNRQGVVSGLLNYQIKAIQGLSFRLQGTLKKAGNSKSPNYYLANTGFGEQNYAITAGYNRKNFESEIYYSRFNTKLGIFSGSHIGNLTDLQLAINSPVPLVTSGFTYNIGAPYQTINHDLYKVRTSWAWPNRGKIEAVWGSQLNQRAEYDIHNPNSPELKLRLNTQTARLSFEHKLSTQIAGIAGIDGQMQTNVYGGSRVFIPNFRSYNAGAFWTERWLGNRWEFEAGARYDYRWMQVFKREKGEIIAPIYHFQNVSATGGAMYSLNDHVKLKLNLSSAFRPPAINELFSEGLHHGSATIERGDRNLKAERNYNLAGSALVSLKNISGEIAIYHNYIANYIYLAPQVPAFELTIRGAFPVFAYNQTDAAFSGIDLNFCDTLTRQLLFLSKTSLLRARNLIANENLVLVPPARFENELRLFSKHGLGTLQDPYFGISHVFVARKQGIPDGRDFAPTPKAYILLNLNMGCSLTFGKQPLDINFSVNNLLNTSYRDYLDRFRYYADAPGRNFMFRVKIPFDWH